MINSSVSPPANRKIADGQCNLDKMEEREVGKQGRLGEANLILGGN